MVLRLAVLEYISRLDDSNLDPVLEIIVKSDKFPNMPFGEFLVSGHASVYFSKIADRISTEHTAPIDTRSYPCFSPVTRSLGVQSFTPPHSRTLHVSSWQQLPGCPRKPKRVAIGAPFLDEEQMNEHQGSDEQERNMDKNEFLLVQYVPW